MLSSRAAAVLLFVLLGGVGVGSALLGSRLAADMTEPNTRMVAIDDPAGSARIPDWAGRSEGGFTGFGGLPALPGVIFRSGVIAEHEEGVIIVDSDDARTTINYRSPIRLFRIRPAAEPLAAGDVVVVRLVDGRTAGVLRLLVEIEEGAIEPAADEGD